MRSPATLLSILLVLSSTSATVACAGTDDVVQGQDDVTAAAIDKKFAALEKSVNAAQIDEVTDYGRSFSFSKYPKGTHPKKVVADVTGYEEDDIDLGGFSNRTGAAAIESVADRIYAEAKDLESDDDTAAANALKAVSRDLYAFKGTESKFAAIKSYSHSIAEDGDLQSDTLIFTKTDGSLVVFGYTHFPF